MNFSEKLIKVLLHRMQPQFIAFHFLYFSYTTCFGLCIGHLQATKIKKVKSNKLRLRMVE
jgi:hypothetical protein